MQTLGMYICKNEIKCDTTKLLKIVKHVLHGS